MTRSEWDRHADMENTVKHAVGPTELLRLGVKYGPDQVLYAISDVASFHQVPEGEGIGSSDMYYIRRSLYSHLGEPDPLAKVN